MSSPRRGNGKDGQGALVLAHQQLREKLAAARGGSERLKLILESQHAEALVPALPAEELFFTIKEVGLSDSLELVHLASPEQFRTFVDLDGWSGDHLEPSRTLAWLHAARSDDDDARVQKKLQHLDIEVIELLLKGALRIWDLEEDPDPEPESDRIFRSPENRYLVEFSVDGAEYTALRGLLESLYAEDPFKGARMLEAVRWELASELEETALRWRTGRLADLGFPPVDEALSYFAWIDPDRALPSLERPPPVPAGFFLARLQTGDRFFDKAVAQVPAAEREPVERQLVTLVNAVMVAEQVDPADADAVAAALRSTRDTLSLGLEHAAAGEVAKGAALLSEAPIKRVFQVGASLALRLKFRADRLMKSGRCSWPSRPNEPLFDSPLAEAVVALRRKRPQYCEALADASLAPERLRPFRDRADIERAEQALVRAERWADILERLGLRLADAEKLFDLDAGARFSDLLLTAAVGDAIGRSFQFVPLTAADLVTAAELVFQRDGDTVSVSEEFATQLRSRLEAAAAVSGDACRGAAQDLAELCLSRLREEAAGQIMASGRLDAELPLPFVVR